MPDTKEAKRIRVKQEEGDPTSKGTGTGTGEPPSALNDVMLRCVEEPTSSKLGEPRLHPCGPLNEESLFTYEVPTEDENDPLADPSLGSLPQSSHFVDLVDDKSPMKLLMKFVENFKPPIISKDLNSASSASSDRAKLPSCNHLENVDATVKEKPTFFDREISFQEQSSIESPRDTTASNPLPSVTSKKTPVKFTAGEKTDSKRTPRTRSLPLTGPEKEILTDFFAPLNRSQKPSLFCAKLHNLDHRAKSIIYHLASYFKDKKKNLRLNFNVPTFVGDATSLPKRTVQDIISMGRRSLQDDPSLEFPRFARYHTEKCKYCGDVLVDSAIREMIFKGYVEERKALTIKEISASLDADELYVCQDFLRRRIRELGFDLMRSVASARYIPLERPELTASRYRYFQDIEKYRTMQRRIVYVFETDLSLVAHGKVTWEPLEGHPTKDDARLMTVVHAASESGFINGTLFVHSNTLRQHRKSMWPLTIFWLNLCLPALPMGSVVVLGHSRHNFVRPAKPKPDASWPKQDIVKWLEEHQQGSFSSALPCAVLLEKVHTVSVGSEFGIDDLIIKHGHIPLHLPQNHRELNPVELVWRKILEKFPFINIFEEGHMKDFLQNEFDSVSFSELQEAFELAKKHENVLRNLDMKIEEPLAEVIRHVGGILDRNYAVEEYESDDDETSIDQVLDRVHGRIPVKRTCSNKRVLSVQPTKKKKVGEEIGANVQSREMSKQCQGDEDNVQLRTSIELVQSKENGTSKTEAADLRVGLTVHSAESIPQSSSPSWNILEGLLTQGAGDCGSRLSTTSDDDQAEQPYLWLSSCGSLFAPVPTDTDIIPSPTGSETTDISSVDFSYPGPSNFSTKCASRSESVADVSGITLANPFKAQGCSSVADVRDITLEDPLQEHESNLL